MKKIIAIAAMAALVLIGISFNGKFIGGAKPAFAQGTCTPSSFHLGSGLSTLGNTASVSIPAPGASCTQSFITEIAVSITGPSGCDPMHVELLDGTTDIWNATLSTNVYHPSDSRLETFAPWQGSISNGSGFTYYYPAPTLTSTSGGTLKFTSACTNGYEDVYVTGMHSL
jgi:hypothetical protein